MDASATQIVEAIEGASSKLEVSETKTSIRRIGNPELPKQLRKREMKARDKGSGIESEPSGQKRAKTSNGIKINGVFYEDFNRIKSRARVILNLKKDSEKLVEDEHEFIKELLKFHPKASEKL